MHTSCRHIWLDYMYNTFALYVGNRQNSKELDERVVYTFLFIRRQRAFGCAHLRHLNVAVDGSLWQKQGRTIRTLAGAGAGAGAGEGAGICILYAHNFICQKLFFKTFRLTLILH